MYSCNVRLCFVVFSFNSGKFSAKFPENNTSLVIREFSAYDKNLIGHMLEPFNATLYLSPLSFIFLTFAEFWAQHRLLFSVGRYYSLRIFLMTMCFCFYICFSFSLLVFLLAYTCFYNSLFSCMSSTNVLIVFPLSHCLR